MPGHFGARVDIVGILRYQVDVLENEAVEIVDLGSLGVADVEELGAIELAHRALLDHEYPIVQVLRLQKRVYVIHENGKLAVPVAIGQYNGHVEKGMAIEGLPLAARQDAESTCHRHRILPRMLLRVQQLGGPPAADGDRARVVPRRVRPLHLVVDVLGLDERVVGGEPRRMEAVAQQERHRHGVGQPAGVI